MTCAGYHWLLGVCPRRRECATWAGEEMPSARAQLAAVEARASLLCLTTERDHFIPINHTLAPVPASRPGQQLGLFA